MSYKVFLSNQAKKFINNCPKELQTRIKAKLSLLSEPFDVDYIKIKGEEDTYRTRLGDYRILFLVQKNENIVVIIRIDKRSRVYKR